MNVLKVMKAALVEILVLPVRIYRLLISPLKPPTCRYVPSCSEYFIQAVKKRGPITGLLIGILRLLRCHPFGGSGYDPVPDRGLRYRDPGERLKTNSERSRGPK